MPPGNSVLPDGADAHDLFVPEQKSLAQLHLESDPVYNRLCPPGNFLSQYEIQAYPHKTLLISDNQIQATQYDVLPSMPYSFSPSVSDIFLADIFQTAFITMGFRPGSTHVSSMINKSVTKITALLRRNDLP